MRDIRGFKRRNRNQTFLHGLMDYAKTLKLRFWLGDLDLPKRRKRRGIPVVGRKSKMYRCAFVAKPYGIELK